MSLDLIAVGRISVDLYGNEAHAGFADAQTFTKSIGGSPTNVAVAAARLGLSSAIATKVGSDPLGGYAVAKLNELGVDTRYVTIESGGLTPVVLTALDPPETPQILFHRGAAAPDTTMTANDIPIDEVKSAGALWISAAALAAGSTSAACLEWMGWRDRERHTLVDLDYRPTLWPHPRAARTAALLAIDLATVVIGNREECEVAIGESEPNAAADALLARGVELAVVKQGAEGVLLATANERISVRQLPIEVRCGLGAGDAFGGALVRGLGDGLSLSELGAAANAAGALVATRLMCADSMPDSAELDDFMSQWSATEGSFE